MAEIKLLSSDMVHTAGILRWAMNGYRFKDARPQMRNVLQKTYGLTRKCADDLLSGRVEWRELASEDGAVIFQYSSVSAARTRRKSK